jgi:hypothetical protein
LDLELRKGQARRAFSISQLGKKLFPVVKVFVGLHKQVVKLKMHLLHSMDALQKEKT